MKTVLQNMQFKKFPAFSLTKTTSLLIWLGVLMNSWACGLFLPEQDMFDRATLRKVFAAVQEKGIGKEPLYEIEINYNEVYFSGRFERFVYSKGFLSRAKSTSTGESKPFQLAEAAVFDLDQVRSQVLEFAKKNPYLKNPGISRIVIHKENVSRGDNLVSNVGKQREALRCEIYLADKDTEAHYTTNLQGEIVDVAAANVKPRLNFFDAEQMNKSLAEIKSRFGGRMSVADFDIHIENFSFTATDPQNSEEINDYYFNSQEFLQANKSPAQKSLEDKKRDEEMRRGGTPEEVIRMRYLNTIFFDIGEIDFSLIPQLSKKTLEAAKASNPKITGIKISKHQDRFTKVLTLEWRVETIGDRTEKESVIFDGKGNLKNEEK